MHSQVIHNMLWPQSVVGDTRRGCEGDIEQAVVGRTSYETFRTVLGSREL